jgi:hypothetical protein
MAIAVIGMFINDNPAYILFWSGIFIGFMCFYYQINKDNEKEKENKEK